MSHFSEVRAAFAAALSAVDGVRGFEKKPVSRQVGDAWPAWASGTHVTGGAYSELGWTVYVYLPSDDDARDTWISGHLTELTEALLPVAWVDGAAPGTVDDQPVLTFTCRE